MLIGKQMRRNLRRFDGRADDAVATDACFKSVATIPDLSAAIADISAAISELSAESKAQSAEISAERKDQSENISALCALRSALPKVGPNPLPAPTLGIMSVGRNSIVVDWDKVNNASGYKIEVANDSAFTDSVTLNIDAAATSWNIDGLNANTTYYIRIMATGTGANGNSAFSNMQSITTLNDGATGMGGGMTGDLQSWLEEQQTLFQTFSTLIPQLTSTELNTTDRRRLNGSGVRRYGFIEKTADVATDFPQIWSGIVGGTGKLQELVGEIEVLRNLLIWFRYLSRVVQDLLLIAGDDAFRLAGSRRINDYRNGQRHEIRRLDGGRP